VSIAFLALVEIIALRRRKERIWPQSLFHDRHGDRLQLHPREAVPECQLYIVDGAAAYRSSFSPKSMNAP
jgi:hypothetical protein